MKAASGDGHLIETRIASEDVFDGRLLHVKRDTVRMPDGAQATREFVVHPGAAMIIPRLPRWPTAVRAAVPLSAVARVHRVSRGQGRSR